MIQVYSLKNDNQHVKDVQTVSLDETNKAGLSIKNGLFGSDEWWKNIENGKISAITLSGKISRVYMSGHNDFEEFEVDDGTSKTQWQRITSETEESALTRKQKADLYIEGMLVKIIYVKQRFKKFAGESSCPIEIWIGE